MTRGGSRVRCTVNIKEAVLANWVVLSPKNTNNSRLHITFKNAVKTVSINMYYYYLLVPMLKITYPNNARVSHPDLCLLITLQHHELWIQEGRLQGQDQILFQGVQCQHPRLNLLADLRNCHLDILKLIILHWSFLGYSVDSACVGHVGSVGWNLVTVSYADCEAIT